MGYSSNYSSAKTGYDSYEKPIIVHTSPKTDSYESSKISSSTSSQKSSASQKKGYNLDFDISKQKESLYGIKDLLTEYLELDEKIEKAEAVLASLKEEKESLEKQIASHPEYEKISSVVKSIDNINGPKR